MAPVNRRTGQCANRQPHATTPAPTLERRKPMSDCGIDCLDCGTPLLPGGREPAREWFMLRPDAWAQTGLAPDDGYLCVGCIERRIGRPLDGADLSGELPINQPNEADSPRTRELKVAALNARARGERVGQSW
jgi:hypothetical protein